MQDGRVLVAGGGAMSGSPVASAEIFNPATNTWTLTASMATPRDEHSAVRLNNGKVLVIGGSTVAAGTTSEL
jgi:NAD(P)H-hydrate repair Nnr-like enzyme with NAD(P)H-hydrate dehydratase domain